MNELPDDPKLEQNGEEYLFTWTLLEITNMTLTIVAMDSKGAATTFSPTVELCACANNGNCTLDGLLTSSPTIVMNCDCSEGMFIQCMSMCVCVCVFVCIYVSVHERCCDPMFQKLYATKP